MPAAICSVSLTTRHSVSEPKILADGALDRVIRGAAFCAAASVDEGRREVRHALEGRNVSAIMLAILSLMRPNSPMGRPNALRSCTRSTAILMRRLQPAHASTREAEAPAVEHLHRDLESAAVLTQDRVLGDANVLEEHLGGRRASDPELVLVGHVLYAPRALYDERREPRLRAFVGRRGGARNTVNTSACAPLVIQIFDPLRM